MLKDTDSLTYENEMNDVCADSYAQKNTLDRSENSENLKFYHKMNKKVTGKMKDENESVRLFKKAKGINRNLSRCRNVKENKMHFQEKNE